MGGGQRVRSRSSSSGPQRAAAAVRPVGVPARGPSRQVRPRAGSRAIRHRQRQELCQLGAAGVLPFSLFPSRFCLLPEPCSQLLAPCSRLQYPLARFRGRPERDARGQRHRAVVFQAAGVRARTASASSKNRRRGPIPCAAARSRLRQVRFAAPDSQRPRRCASKSTPNRRRPPTADRAGQLQSANRPKRRRGPRQSARYRKLDPQNARPSGCRRGGSQTGEGPPAIGPRSGRNRAAACPPFSASPVGADGTPMPPVRFGGPGCLCCWRNHVHRANLGVGQRMGNQVS